MTASSSHLPAPTKVWIGLRGRPASMAIGSQVLRSRPLSRPRMTRVALWRCSTAVEPGEVALEEGGQAVRAAFDGLGGERASAKRAWASG